MGAIQIPFTTPVTAQNEVTFVRVTEAGQLLIGIRPFMPTTYQPLDSSTAYPLQATITRPILIQELGLAERPIRYQVEAHYGRYRDERGIIHHLLLPVPGLSLRQGVSDAVFAKIMALIVEHHLPPMVAFQVIEQLYGVQIKAGIGHFFIHRATVTIQATEGAEVTQRGTEKNSLKSAL